MSYVHSWKAQIFVSVSFILSKTKGSIFAENKKKAQNFVWFSWQWQKLFNDMCKNLMAYKYLPIQTSFSSQGSLNFLTYNHKTYIKHVSLKVHWVNVSGYQYTKCLIRKLWRDVNSGQLKYWRTCAILATITIGFLGELECKIA